MSYIDQFKVKLFGFINCPSTFPIIFENTIRDIALYELEENVDDGVLNAQKGDLIVGGGSGEAPMMQIKMKEAFEFFQLDSKKDYELSQVVKTFWTPNQSYIFCEGYSKLGWNPDEPIEQWIANRVVAFWSYVNKKKFKSRVSVDISICK